MSSMGLTGLALFFPFPGSATSSQILVHFYFGQQEYLVFVAQLEHRFKLGQLSLQKLFTHVSSTVAATLVTLDTLARDARRANLKGGALLGLLYDRVVTCGYV
jgi:hypothetical protein